jgi:intein-encoded DNA endonuclease-like protein
MNISEIEKVYKETKSLRATAKHFNTSKNKITDILKENNIKINESTRNRKYIVNSNYFNDINSEEKAYWLGFLFADGYNEEEAYKVRIELKESDSTHLEKLKLSLNSKHPIKWRNAKKSCWLSIADKKMSQDLVKLGMIQNKSLSLEFPKINKELTSHLIRGYFDGDGSLYRIGKNSKGISILGNLSFLNVICDILKSQSIIGKIRKSGKIHRFEIHKIKDVNLFLDYIYSNSTIYLDRKYNKMRELQRLQ